MCLDFLHVLSKLLHIIFLAYNWSLFIIIINVGLPVWEIEYGKQKYTEHYWKINWIEICEDLSVKNDTVSG